jgi:Pyruvate/2-oxoacid:ferredoxin oxidoreductase delta subunit
MPVSGHQAGRLLADDGKEHKRIETDKALCKGCGICMATCPKGA